jgi:hypothetical protein
MKRTLSCPRSRNPGERNTSAPLWPFFRRRPAEHVRPVTSSPLCHDHTWTRPCRAIFFCFVLSSLSLSRGRGTFSSRLALYLPVDFCSNDNCARCTGTKRNSRNFDKESTNGSLRPLIFFIILHSSSEFSPPLAPPRPSNPALLYRISPLSPMPNFIMFEIF